MIGTNNVVTLRPRTAPQPVPADPWQRLTAKLVMEKHRRGELPPALIEYLLAAAGLQP